MITKLSEFNESILVPRNLDSRQEKLKQQNFKLLQQEVIKGDLTIDSNFDFNVDQVKVKTIKGNVTLQLDHFPSWLKDVTIEGYFNCSHNELITLEGCPQSVGSSFYCDHNQLTTLEGCPQSVGGFYCNDNKLTTLEGCPQTVGRDFYCDHNELISLEGCPSSIDGDFYCNNNQLTTLEGCPRSVRGYFNCRYNPVKFTEDYVQTLSNVKGRIYC